MLFVQYLLKSASVSCPAFGMVVHVTKPRIAIATHVLALADAVIKLQCSRLAPSAGLRTIVWKKLCV